MSSVGVVLVSVFSVLDLFAWLAVTTSTTTMVTAMSYTVQSHRAVSTCLRVPVWLFVLVLREIRGSCAAAEAASLLISGDWYRTSIVPCRVIL